MKTRSGERFANERGDMQPKTEQIPNRRRATPPRPPGWHHVSALFVLTGIFLVLTSGAALAQQQVSDVEQETTRVDANTVRVVQRSFYRDANGNRQLLQVTEEQHISLEGGHEQIVRTTSKLDAVGGLQLASREVQESTIGADGTRQSSSTVWAVRGGDLVPVERGYETRRRVGDTDEVRRTVMVPDVNGGFRKVVDTATVTAEAAGTQTTEATTVADDGSGHMTTVGRTVTKITHNAQGETRASESFSLFTPGMAADGNLHRVQQVTTVKQTLPDGSVRVRRDTDRIVAGDSTDTLSPASTTIEVTQPAGPGKIHQDVTILGPNDSGVLPRIWVMGGRQTTYR